MKTPPLFPAGLAALFLVLAAPAWAQVSVDAKKIYETKCASCHAKDGKGKPTMAKPLKLKDAAVLDLTREDATKKDDKDWIIVVKDGQGKMPSYSKKLTEQEIVAVVDYIRALAPAPKK